MNPLHQNFKWQRDTSSISDRLWDVVIVGAGPAGATAAAHLASDHHRVLLLDREKFPREKICGDGLLADALRCLDTIGVGEKIRAAGCLTDTCSLFSPSQNEIEIPGEYLTVKRSLLDMIVAQRASDLGAFFACGEVKQFWVDPDGLVTFTIQGNGRQFRARIGILATGTDIRLLRKLNWPAKKRPSAIALRCYVHSTCAIDRFIVSYDQSTVPGYAWIFPLRDLEYNVGCGIALLNAQQSRINLKRTFSKFVDAFPLARELMRQSDRTTALKAAALRSNFEGGYHFVNGPVVAVGETIGTTLPFLGEGIGKAMESGQQAAAAVSAALDSDDLSRLTRYEQYIESELKPRYRSYWMAEKWLARHWLNDFLINRFGKSKYAKEVLTGIIAETRNPQELFSLMGILKTFWN